MEEEWKDIVGFEGLYQISNYGRVLSFHHGGHKYLSLKNYSGGYLSVSLSNKKKKAKGWVHRLVAESFVGKPVGNVQVNHKDLNKQNNHVDNLEWVTSRENTIHSVTNNPSVLDGMKHYSRFIRPRQVVAVSKDGSFYGQWANCVEASKETGIRSSNIYQAAAKAQCRPGITRKSAGGYKWYFAEKGADYAT